MAQGTPDAGREAQAFRPASAKPPYNRDAEEIVVGCMLLDPGTVLDLCRGEYGITGESFYLGANRLLFETIAEMYGAGEQVEAGSLIVTLEGRGRLEEAGGAEGVVGIVEHAASTAYAEFYIKQVADLHLRRRVLDAARRVTEQCYTPDVETGQLLSAAESTFLQLSEGRKRTMKSWHDLTKDEMKELIELSNGKKVSGVSTGFVDLDEMLLGMQPSDLLILAARPSMGKTALALNIAENVATGRRKLAPKPVGVFSLEMSASSLARRMICGRAGVSAHNLAGGQGMSKEAQERLTQATSDLMDAPIYVDDTAGLEVDEMRSRARRMRSQHGVELIVVDYLQLMNCSARARDGRQQETAAISQGLKAMAKELQIPVLVLSQFSRAPETRGKDAIPKLSDLRDSGAIEQDADVVMLLRRPSYYYKNGAKESTDERLAIVDVAKHRNGPVGEVRMNFEAAFARFDNRQEAADAVP